MHKLTTGALVAGSVAAAALLGAQFSPRPGTEAGEWYRRLDKSPLTPPDQVFGPVWTLLYGMIATAGYRVGRARRGDDRTAALRIWSAQLAVNAAWNPIFFGAKKPRAAFGVIIALLALQVAFIRQVRGVDRVAARLFVPYLLWTLFAGFLNAEVVRRIR